ncbi:MerR family transcriptional regulator [Actinocatenispora rupis]|uniref:MerR family transcriptional regulator n=1 Tax=Actinocatenispora rupis TaxID=519421 RepID=A0A8J3J9P4_9ACTN|nr:MerR family transcriptional regulator [Actinocatenispora rupis]GID12654.1 MerR family transcriptional regulator [Actinocatenispora rupis]
MTGMSIGQVAERTGLSVHALRFYEREGILAAPVRRGSDGRRVYDEHDVDWLALCVSFRESGMPLAEIRRYTELVRQGSGNESERLALLRAHEERIGQRMGELARSLDMIRHKVRVYEEHLAEGTAGRLWSGATTGGEVCRMRGTEPESASS